MITIGDIEYIRLDDSTEELMEAGVVPEWIGRDAIAHGMYLAEYLLYEYDWEWGWDLGDGYTAEHRKTLAEMRDRIRKGIKNFYGNKDLVAQYKERKRLEKLRKERRDELWKTYIDHYIDRENFKWLVEYDEKHGSLPILHFICFRSLLPTRTDLQKAILLRIGVTCEEPMAIENIKAIYPEMSDDVMKSLAYHNWPLYKNYKTLVEKAVAALPSPIPAEDDSYWSDLINDQRLDEFDMTPARLRRLMVFFSLNKKTQAQKRKGSVGVY